MLANWVKQAVTAGGIGNLTLGSADAGFIDLNTAIGQGPRFPYVIEDGNNRETGIGYLSDASTLVRELVLETLVSGVLTLISPSPLNVTTAAKVSISATAGQVDRLPNSIAADYENLGYIMDAGAGNSSTLGAVANRLFVSSFYLPCRAVVSGLGMEVTTAAAGSAVAGIYQSISRASMRKLAQTISQYDTGTTGVKTASLASAKALNPGFYILAVHLSAAASLRSSTGTLGQLAWPVGSTGGIGARYSMAYTYSATLPDDLVSSNFQLTVTSTPRQFLIGA